MESTIVISELGTLRWIWTDDLSELASEGAASIERASHVEPEGIQWVADLGPSGGPRLEGFAKRQDAIDAEIKWLQENRGL